MNSSIINIAEILNTADYFLSAGFSNGYGFKGTTATEFFDELIENSSDSEPFFAGILVIKRSGNDFTIVDGLQRITTLNLLLMALCENYKNTTEQNAQASGKIFNRYLMNKNESKLKLIEKEQGLYNKLLFSKELNEDEKNSKLFQTYSEFLDLIKSRNISGTKLFQIISKIQFVALFVDSSDVATRDLYQALNQKEESQMNLISDFISHKMNANAVLIWQQVINSFKYSQIESSFDEFVRAFLIVQNGGKTPKKTALYNNFKSYYSQISKYKDSSEIINTISEYSEYYQKIISADFDDYEIKTQIEKLNENKGRDSYPYLMEVLDDLKNEHIDRTMFLDILNMINTFVQNRLENSLSETTVDFATLSQELNKMLVLKAHNPNISDEDKFTINEMNNLSTFGV